MKRLALALVVTSACATASEVDELRENQRRLQDRIEQLEKRALDGEKRARAARGPDPDKVYDVPVGTSPSTGRDNAPITIVEFGEFQCPFCARVQPTLRRLRQAYGDDIRIVWKHNPLPFHDRAMPAARASQCAHAQDRFWPMHDALFASPDALSDDAIMEAATSLGLDEGAFRACLVDTTTNERIQADVKLAMELGARGTPSFFINGRSLQGAQPYEAFAALIDEELRKRRKP